MTQECGGIDLKKKREKGVHYFSKELNLRRC